MAQSIMTFGPARTVMRALSFHDVRHTRMSGREPSLNVSLAEDAEALPHTWCLGR